MSYVISESDILIEGKNFEGSLSAHMRHEDGRPYHTFRTATVLVNGNRVKFKNCRIANTAGSGRKVGQAIALYLDGDDIVLEDCMLEGHQDTLFLAPLPPHEYQKDGFLGPGQFTPRTRRTVSFKNCKISGGVDFIFGGATAYFDNCEFVSVEEGYVFAPSTPEDVQTGFVARNCRFTATDDVKEESCYIARPWREYAKVRLEQCYLGEHIHKEGFHDWGKTEARGSVVFEEIGSYGPGAQGAVRPDYVHFLSGKQE